MHWIHTSFQGRWGQASPRNIDDIFLLLSFSFFYLSIFFAPYSLTIHDSTLPSCIVCPNDSSSSSRFSSVYYYIVSFLFLYIAPSIYNIMSVLSFPSFFLSLFGFFKRKKPNTDWLLFFCGTFCVCMFLCFDCCCSSSFLVPITICMYVCAYVWKEEREEKHDDDDDERRRKKKEIESGTFIMIIVIIIIISVVVVALTKCKIILMIIMFWD